MVLVRGLHSTGLESLTASTSTYGLVGFRSALQYREDKDWSLVIPCVSYERWAYTLFYSLALASFLFSMFFLRQMS